VTSEWRLIEPIVALADGQPVGDFLGRPRDPALQLFRRCSRSGERRVAAEKHPDVVAELQARVQARRELAASYTGIPDPFRITRPSLPYAEMVSRFESRERRSW
jgi:hypothetical protein